MSDQPPASNERASCQKDGDPPCATGRIVIRALTPDRWADLEALFGPNGACAGCWCMYWRDRKPAMGTRHSAANREAFKAIVDRGEEPGVLATIDDRPVGWCAIAPRERFHKLENSRDLKRVDDQPVWAITCFFIHRTERRNGLMLPLVLGAVAHAASHGATLVEGYPIGPGGQRLSSGRLFTGVETVFARAGFVAVLRRNPYRPIYRLALDPTRLREAVADL